MKKLLFSFAFASSIATIIGQQSQLDFENLNLVQADTFYNGSDNAMQYSMSTNFGNTATFSNYFGTSQWGDYWGGFAYSNMTDATTVGIENQYSSIVGKGANNSEKYGIYYPEGTITFSQNTFVDSIFLTNTTYAYMSMLNGDMFAKQFGSTTNASGEVDGTNGEDFLKVWIFALNESGVKTDSIEFYLADFRFADNAQDYILNDWNKVDLTSLGLLRSLAFRFESSDMSFGYINTPTYFAIDNLFITNTLAVEKESITSVDVFPNPVINELSVSGSFGKLSVYDFEGKIIFETELDSKTSIDFSSFDSGVYFLKLENEFGNYTEKIIK